ncbi:MAG: hypothetical protein LRY73_05220 [Bacillus sp. (in: Bacteria)]|nr:hypothetical protein [Bacillus sp. (in: firmicutes)]
METYNQTAFPPLGLFDHESFTLKGEHEVYDVFVNDESVKKKLVITENDKTDSIVDFLKQQGVKNVSTHINGDHYNIQTEDGERVKAIIDAYIRNR